MEEYHIDVSEIELIIIIRYRNYMEEDSVFWRSLSFKLLLVC